MNWITNMKVSTKLIGGFLIVAVITAIVGGIGIRSAGQINHMAFTMYDRDTIGLRHTAAADLNLLLAERAIRNAILAPTAELRATHSQAMTKFLDDSKAELDLAGAKFATEQGKALVAETKAAIQAYETGLNATAKVLQTEGLMSGLQSVALLSGEVRPLANKTSELMQTLKARKLNDAHTLDLEAEALYTSLLKLLIILTLGGIVLGIVLGVLITRGLTRQLGGEPRDVALTAGAIANGDLTYPNRCQQSHKRQRGRGYQPDANLIAQCRFDGAQQQQR